ncbi:MAG: LacI family DNA-binding transcriptional regulator [Chitinophagaceae bacterium]
MSNMTLKKIAEELKISPSTVSRSLRDSHEISQETKDRVRALVAKLDFQPNPHASSLRKNKSKTIAVIIPEIENNFFVQVLNGIEEVAQKNGYHVLIYITHENYQREADILHMLRSGRVDGIMISVASTTTNFEHLTAYVDLGVPLVFFDRVCEIMDAPCVTTDDVQAAFEATEHLIKTGCSKIAFLSLDGNLSISSRRRSGYLEALKKYGLLNNKVIVECGLDNEVNRQKIRSLFQGKDTPDAIFTAVEKFSITTYEVCKELHIKIPEQVKMISFSNLTAASLFNPSLSAIIQPAHSIGRESADILFRLIDRKKLLPAQKNVIIPSHLVVRESSPVQQAVL